MADLEAFREHVRSWLEANYPASLRKRGPQSEEMEMAEAEAIMSAGPTGDLKTWTQKFGETGWGVPLWPKQYGGGGLSVPEARVLQQEMAKQGIRNPIGGMGTMMFGPTLLEYGNEEQKLRHIPKIATNEVRWCQGFSEPGAGSDLASLQTKCEDKGDHYLINGQKIWTSGAQYADWCFCLVRTDTTKKHEGISFILIDMKTPGVSVKPIKLISGNSPFCETFFDNVKVPKENLVGELNKGWTIAKRLLQFERQNLSGGGGLPGGSGGGRGGGGGGMAAMMGMGGGIHVTAKKYIGEDAKGRLADTDLRARLSTHAMEAKAMQLTLMRAAMEARGNQGPSASTSIIKNVGSKVGQDRSELTIEIFGNRGFGWEGEGFSAAELGAVKGWLGGKATSIYGGSQEIQNNIISKRILELPDSNTQNG
jgi:alkylation response protein AidB-like acyl-CoA dehydrogenase